MAQFRGTVQGGRGEAARLGHKSTGLSTTCRGWNLGVDCHASTEPNDRDVISVSVNEGNGYNAGRRIYLGIAVETADGPTFQPSEALVEMVLMRVGYSADAARVEARRLTVAA